ncbi:hypothetical protein M514_28528, partial [Trichuris suis]
RLFQRFLSYGVRINPSNCLLATSTFTFLGHQVDCNGVRPAAEKVEAVLTFPAPATTKELRQFRPFWPDIATTLGPLHAIVSRNCQRITLSQAETKTFEAAKRALSNATLPYHPDPSAPTALWWTLLTRLWERYCSNTRTAGGDQQLFFGSLRRAPGQR